MSLPRLLQTADQLSDPDLSRWLRNAVRRIRAGQDVGTAFSLNGQAALDERDRYLRSAARRIAPDVSDWRAADILRGHIAYVLTRPDLLDAYPHMSTEFQDIVAAMLCAELPTSQRRLYDCLADARGCRATENAAELPLASGQIG